MTKKAAFLGYYRQYKDKIFNYFWYRVGFKTDLAEDLTSEVFLKAFRHFDDFDQERPFQPWIYRIAHNHLLNHYRQNGREIAIDDGIEIAVDSCPDIESGIDAEWLRRCISDLPPGPREVLVMRYVDGLEYEEMSEVLGREPGTIRVQVSRALAALRRSIGDEYGESQRTTEKTG